MILGSSGRCRRRGAADEAPRGVDVDLRLAAVHQAGGDSGLDDQLDHVLRICSRDIPPGCAGWIHHGVHADGLTARRTHGDLGLAVGPQIVQRPACAGRSAAGHLVGQEMARGISSGVCRRSRTSSPGRPRRCPARRRPWPWPRSLVTPRAMSGLLVDVGDDGAGVAVDSLGPVIADVQHHLPGDLGDIT